MVPCSPADHPRCVGIKWSCSWQSTEKAMPQSSGLRFRPPAPGERQDKCFVLNQLLREFSGLSSIWLYGWKKKGNTKQSQTENGLCHKPEIKAKASSYIVVSAACLLMLPAGEITGGVWFSKLLRCMHFNFYFASWRAVGCPAWHSWWLLSCRGGTLLPKSSDHTPLGLC